MDNDSPITLLFREPHRFDFFQAVRLLQWLAREKRPVGEDGPPEREAVRFRALPSLAFPSSTVSQLRTTAGKVPEMVVSFLGLTGPGGALPRHYTTMLLRRLRLKDFTLRDFFDLFNHRLLSLFHRAWEKYRLPFVYEKGRMDESRPGTDVVTQGLYSLIGLGFPHLRGCLEIDDEAFLYYAGHFAHTPRTASGLQQVLADYFQVPIQVRQFQGQWVRLEKEDRSRLPRRAALGAGNNQLGVSAIAGTKVWDMAGKFRLKVGPLTYAQFRMLMPRGFGLRPLTQMTRLYVGPQLEFDVQLVLRREEVPRCRLNSRGPDRRNLGWNSWALSRPATRDADDAVFSLANV
jgi:type VI secretion system protein ImpH